MSKYHSNKVVVKQNHVDFYPPVESQEEFDTPTVPKESIRNLFGVIWFKNVAVGDEIPDYGKISVVEFKNDKKVIKFTGNKNEHIFKEDTAKCDQFLHEIGGLVSMSGLLSKKQIGNIVDVIKRDSQIYINEYGNVYVQ